MFFIYYQKALMNYQLAYRLFLKYIRNMCYFESICQKKRHVIDQNYVSLWVLCYRK